MSYVRGDGKTLQAPPPLLRYLLCRDMTARSSAEPAVEHQSSIVTCVMGCLHISEMIKSYCGGHQ
jgi:hypothetical protein